MLDVLAHHTNEAIKHTTSMVNNVSSGAANLAATALGKKRYALKSGEWLEKEQAIYCEEDETLCLKLQANCFLEGLDLAQAATPATAKFYASLVAAAAFTTPAAGRALLTAEGVLEVRDDAGNCVFTTAKVGRGMFADSRGAVALSAKDGPYALTLTKDRALLVRDAAGKAVWAAGPLSKDSGCSVVGAAEGVGYATEEDRDAMLKLATDLGAAVTADASKLDDLKQLLAHADVKRFVSVQPYTVVEMKCWDGSTMRAYTFAQPALSKAVQAKNMAAVKLLLAAGADPEKTPENFTSCMRQACIDRNAEAIHALLEAGATVETPFLYSLAMGKICTDVELFRTLLSHAKLDGKDGDYLVGLATKGECCMRADCPETDDRGPGCDQQDRMLRLVVAAGGRVRRPDDRKAELDMLMGAIDKSKDGILAALLEMGIDPKGRSEQGYVVPPDPRQSVGPLEVLVAMPPTADYTAAAGWVPNAERADKIAAARLRMLKAMQEKGVDVQAKDDQTGRTALFYATGPFIKVLTDAGLDINATDKTGCTPLLAALGRGNNSLKVAVGGPMPKATEDDVNADAEILTARIAAGAKVAGVADDNGNTALHLAALYSGKLVKQLLENGAEGDIKAVNKDGDTPLHLAYKAENADGNWKPEGGPSQVLLDAGADAGAKNKAGELPDAPVAIKRLYDVAYDCFLSEVSNYYLNTTYGVANPMDKLAAILASPDRKALLNVVLAGRAPVGKCTLIWACCDQSADKGVRMIIEQAADDAYVPNWSEVTPTVGNPAKCEAIITAYKAGKPLPAE